MGNVFALTVHECWDWNDSTDTLIDIFFNLEDAKKAMKKYFKKATEKIDLDEVAKNGQKVYALRKDTDRCIELVNEHDGWSCEHICLLIVEKNIK
jgi:hypothetical protein